MKKLFYQLTLIMLVAMKSLVVLATDTFTATRTDFRDESIYFMITTRFYDGDPTNNVLCWDNQQQQIATKDPCWRGDFKGIIDKLDYIKALGFTAIWITPVVQNGSGYDYHGYHAMDFSKVDIRYKSKKEWGASEDVDFQQLIDAAHAKGIKIILDIVLNHTGNFGEATLCPEFTRNENIKYQATAESCLKPNAEVLGSDYATLKPGDQYQRRLALMKNTDGKNHDIHNYWHHVGNGWNWDEPSRWWGQIAGDCVDLNTENPAVAAYLVKCYGEFIKMGVDGFRIDTSGHISRLTYNTSFIPQLKALGEQYADKRLLAGQSKPAPFYMFGEVCTRFGEVTYRNHPNLSTYFYTWASDASLMGRWNNDASWWDSQVVPEGAAPLGNMTLCLEEADVTQTSSNATLNGNSYHTPDYSKASGFYVIDFPVHYNFTHAGSAYNMAIGGDHLYNDATWNVTYVDSHDYGPQPNDQVRFTGGTNQWAENLTWMFLFRGIPCIYYGSEVEFQAGKKIDNGPNGPLSDTGRAYFGQNIEGDVSAVDFGKFTASGQVSKTLNHPLARHLEQLNRIRQAIPALRKGQYSTQGCKANGGYAWKKRYTAEGIDSYVLVCMNGGATFTGIEAGTYKDAVTGQTFQSNGSLTVSCPSNQGNARVLVKDGTFALGEDGPFLYGSTPGYSDNSPLAKDLGTTWLAPVSAPNPQLIFSPTGGSFSTETQTVQLSLNDDATNGWYEIDGHHYDITGPVSFTIGAGMKYGDTKTIAWGATGMIDGETVTNKGSYTYLKADPNIVIDVYFVDKGGWGAPRIWVWNDANGKNYAANDWNTRPVMTATGEKQDGYDVYKWTYTGTLTDIPTGVIFTHPSNDGQRAGGGNLAFVNHGYYNSEGFMQTTGITAAISSDSTRPFPIYNINGQLVATANNIDTALYSLSRGLYIINGKKYRVK